MLAYLKARGALFQNRSFNCACVMNIFSALVVGVAYISISWHLLTIYNSVNAIIIFMFTWWVSSAVLSPMTGYYADKFPRHKIIMIATGARVLLIGGFLLFGTMQSLTAIYIFSSIWGVILAFFIPAMLILVREMLPDDSQLLYANSTMDGIFEVGMVVGMSLGGLLVALVSMHTILYIMLFGTIVAFIASFGMKPARAVREHSGSFIENWREVYHFLNQRRFVWWYYLGLIGFTCLFMVAPNFFGPYVKNVLHASSLQFGLVETCFSVGFIVGTVILPLCADIYGEVKTIVVSLLVLIVAYCIIIYIPNITVMMSCAFILGVSISCWAIVITLAQKNTAIELQGKAQGVSYGGSGMVVMAIYTMIFMVNQGIELPTQYWFYFMMVLAVLVILPLLRAAKLEAQSK